MENKKLQELILWLNVQINYTGNVIDESHNTSNIGREMQYEGMRSAFTECLNKFMTIPVQPNLGE